MRKTHILVATVTAALLAASPVLAQSSSSSSGSAPGASAASSAGESKGNSEAARGMASTLSETPGIGGVAPSVSGKNATGPGDSGWGNAGSREVSGDQVSAEK